MSEETPTLDSLQSWMQQSLILPAQVDRTELEGIVAPSPRRRPDQGLAIYQRSRDDGHGDLFLSRMIDPQTAGKDADT